MSECDLDTSVPDWIIDYPETLAIFQKFGIDCSCGGKSLSFACHQQGLDDQLVLLELLSCINANVRRTDEHHRRREYDEPTG